MAEYDAIADWYDQTLRQGALVHELVLPALFEVMGDLAGRRVCDLACGQGIVAREAARRGAVVVGIDLSERLLAIARAEEAARPLGVVYQAGDAQGLAGVPDACFDGVACCLALTDIPDLAATADAVRRVLRPGGWFVFAITHPCFEAPHAWWGTADDGAAYRAVRGYFVEGRWFSTNPDGVRGKVGAYHRTLATYLNTLVTAGLTLDRLAEPRPDGPAADRLPPGYTVVPAMLVARFHRA